MLCLTREELACTDIADHALEVLERSRVSEIVIVGRRGPAQAAFTTPELLELGELSDADVIVDPAELERALAIPDPTATPTSERNVAVLREYAARPPPAAGDGSFCASCSRRRPSSPTRTGASRRSSSVRNELLPAGDGKLRAQATGERERIDAGLLFRAIGYRGVPLPGVPFDERVGVIPNTGGRVLDPSSGAPLPGEYVVGWIKRGPSGVIGTNKKDAQETVDAIIADVTAPPMGAPVCSRPARPTPQPLRACCAHASRPSSPMTDGLRSTATSGPSARNRVALA